MFINSPNNISGNPSFFFLFFFQEIQTLHTLWMFESLNRLYRYIDILKSETEDN